MEEAETEAVRPTEVTEAALEEDPKATEAADPTTEFSWSILHKFFFSCKKLKIIKKNPRLYGCK